MKFDEIMIFHINLDIEILNQDVLNFFNCLIHA